MASARVWSLRGLVLDEFRLDPQGRTGSGDAGPDLGPTTGPQDGGGSAAGQLADLLDGGDHTVGGVAVLQAGSQQQLAQGVVVMGGGTGRIDGRLRGLVQLDRNDHPGQDDGLGQGQHRQVLGFSHVFGHVEHPSNLSVLDSMLSQSRLFPGGSAFAVGEAGG